MNRDKIIKKITTLWLTDYLNPVIHNIDWYNLILKKCIFIYLFPNSIFTSFRWKIYPKDLLYDFITYLIENIPNDLLFAHLNNVVWEWNLEITSLILTRDFQISPSDKKALLEKSKYLWFHEIHNKLLNHNSKFILFDHVYRISRVENLDSILTHWLLSRALAKKNLFIDNSYKHIQERRIKKIPYLHSYVPLFFSQYPPMLFSNKVRSNISQNIIIVIDSCILNIDTTLFSDISLAYNDISEENIYSDIADLNKINFDIISKKWWIDNKVVNRIKWAEVLVKDKLDIAYFSKIIYFDETKKSLIENIVKKNWCAISIKYESYENYK